MKYFVEFVVSSLVKHAEEVEVAVVEKPDSIAYLVRLNQFDIGRVIGKNGRTISAIRSLCHAATPRGGRPALVEIVEHR
ncbi:MAG: KH domain-containing protein [Verrucomicrobiales bacterium]|jgi:predicted RNA-binding protein YlqC (UPF0109 family)|nr:KH domain-containing protein [Verrucomicrobiales bacterium]